MSKRVTSGEGSESDDDIEPIPSRINKNTLTTNPLTSLSSSNITTTTTSATSQSTVKNIPCDELKKAAESAAYAMSSLSPQSTQQSTASIQAYQQHAHQVICNRERTLRHHNTALNFGLNSRYQSAQSALSSKLHTVAKSLSQQLEDLQSTQRNVRTTNEDIRLLYAAIDTAQAFTV